MMRIFIAIFLVIPLIAAFPAADSGFKPATSELKPADLIDSVVPETTEIRVPDSEDVQNAGALPADPRPVLIRSRAFQDDARAAIDSLYNRNPEGARQQISEWESDYPDHPIWHLWDAMEVWWRVLEDLYDESLDEELFDVMEKADRAAAELLENDPGHPDGYIIRAVANGYAARHHANRNRWVRSVYTAQTARRAHQELDRLIPDLKDNQLAEGLKSYYSAYLPEAYPVLRPFRRLLPDGDREQGMELLRETSRDGVFTRPEATYFLGIILLRYEERPQKATELFVQLVDSYPDNSYYRRLLVRSLMEQRRDAAAGQAISTALEHWSKDSLPGGAVLKEELYYWQGRVAIRSGHNGEAHDWFVRSWETGRDLPNRTRRSFHALSGYHAGLTSERSGDTDQARAYYMSVINLDCEPDVRRRAEERLAELPG